MKLIHLTDPHFVPKGEKLYGRNPHEALNAAVKDINFYHSDATAVVITGDLTHWGESAAFSNLASCLAPLKPPLQLLVGNHDKRDTFCKYFPAQSTDENGFVQSTMVIDEGTLVFLDTILDGTHAGHYCQLRLSWLSQTLAKIPGDIFLFMHHPPFETGIPAMDLISLKQKSAFWDIISPHKSHIRHLFFGHIHRNISGSWNGIPFSSVRSTNHQVWLDFSSTDIQGSFEPPAYAIVVVDDTRVLIHYHDYMDPSEKYKLNDSRWDDWSRKYLNRKK